MNQIELYSKIAEHLYPLSGDDRIKRVAGVYQALWKINDKRLYGLVNTIGADLEAMGCANPVGHPGTIAATINPLNFEKQSEDHLSLTFKYGKLTGAKLLDFTKQTIVAIVAKDVPQEASPLRYKEAISLLLKDLEKKPALTVARLRVLLHDENVNLKTGVFKLLSSLVQEDSVAKTMLDYIWYPTGSSVHSGLLSEFEELI